MVFQICQMQTVIDFCSFQYIVDFNVPPAKKPII